MTKPRLLVAALVLALAAAGPLACGSSSSKTLHSGSTLTVGYSFPFDTADLAGRVAFAQYARSAHVKVVTRQLMGAPATLSSLLRGDIDMASLNQPDAIKAIGQGAKIHVILGSKMVPEYVFVAGSGITRPAQLKGKRIAVQGHGSDVEGFTRLLLARAGLHLSDARVVTIPNSPARVAAFNAGRVDATALRYHEYLKLKAHDPKVNALSEMRLFQPARMTQVWVVTDRYAKRNRAAVQTLVTQMLRGYDSVYAPGGERTWVAAGQRDVLQGDPPALPGQVYTHYRRIGIWPRASRPIDAASYQRQLQELIADGQVAHAVPYAEVWDPTFWQHAAAGGNAG